MGSSDSGGGFSGASNMFPSVERGGRVLPVRQCVGKLRKYGRFEDARDARMLCIALPQEIFGSEEREAHVMLDAAA